MPSLSMLQCVRRMQARSQTRYVRPERLVLPEARIVYLDLKDWIAFAKVVSGHKDGSKHQEVFELCLQAVESGDVVMPLSLATYAELMKWKSPRQRRHICTAIEILSDGYRTILSEVVLGVLELDQALFDQGMSEQLIWGRVPYIGVGVVHGNGRRMNPRIVDESGRDVTADAFPTLHPIAQKFLDEDRVSQVMSRYMIAGPSDKAAEDKLRSSGWKPESIAQMFEEMCDFENEFAAILAEPEHQPDLLRGDQYDWRNARLRDGVAAREVMYRVMPSLEQLGISPFEVLNLDGSHGALQQTRELTDSLPTFDASVTLKHSLHHDKRLWTVNDIYDITALTVALPYCDVVCTDKAMRHHIDKTGVAERLGTTVVNDLHDLPALLDGN